MAQRIITFGQPYGLQIQIDCARSSSGRLAEEATKGKLLLWIGEDLIWGKSLAFRTDEPIEWSWVELLEFLSNAWPYLEFGYPFGLNPIWPARLRSEAEVRWQSMPDEMIREEEEELLAYEETHDLSRGVHGLLLPSVWICTFPENTEPAATGQGVVSADFSTPIGERPSRARRGSPR